MSKSMEFDMDLWESNYITDIYKTKALLNSLVFLKGRKIQEFWTMGLLI
jgi:hypothetical protein